VDAPVPLPDFVRSLRAAARDDAGIGEEEVSATVTLSGSTNESLDIAFFADITSNRNSLGLFGNGFQAVCVQVRNHDSCSACLRKTDRRGAADAARRAGDDGDLAREFPSYFIAWGLIGEPTAPVIGSGGAQKKNS
jgi:hypothetical protein